MASVLNDPNKGRQLFNSEQYAELKRQQRIIHDLLPEFDKAEACGIECQELRGLAAYIAETLGNIERHYMNPPPQ